MAEIMQTMTKDEYRAALTKLGITQQEVGRLMNAGERTARRWATGETHVPGPVALHIRFWLERPEVLDVVRRVSRQAFKGDKT